MVKIIRFGQRITQFRSLISEGRNGHEFESVEHLPQMGMVAQQFISDIREIKEARNDKRDDVSTENEVVDVNI